MFSLLTHLALIISKQAVFWERGVSVGLGFRGDNVEKTAEKVVFLRNEQLRCLIVKQIFYH